MLNTVAEVFSIVGEDRLKAVRYEFERDLNLAMEGLEKQLARNVLSSDVTNLEQHMGFVEAWRDRLTKYLMVAQALVEHAKSDNFSLPAGIKATEMNRDSHRRALAGGFVAIANFLEHRIDSIDSRVMLCKKLLGLESGTYFRSNAA